MRLTVEVDEGKLELNYMWLPTWAGINHSLKKEIEETLAKEFVGREHTEVVLDEMDDAIINFMVNKFPALGLRPYLEALKNVRTT